MVYFGPSRGCETCKKRRKKCDETRPSCLRCLNTNRVCRGYDAHANGNLVFRQHDQRPPTEKTHALPFNPMARKCSLPARVPVPGSSILPPDILPKEVPREIMEECALRAFFYDFCLVPINPTLSRGFLSGLEQMVHRLGMQSQVAKACMAVGYASHGIKLFRPFLVQRAEELYYDGLRSLAHAMKDSHAINKEETVVMAILLGLYEIIMARDTAPGNHAAHAGGLAALLQIGNDPLSLLESVCSRRSLLPNALRGQGMFSTVCSHGRGKDLDTLFLRLEPMCRFSEIELSLHDTEQLHLLLAEASALDTDIAEWQEAQIDKLKPITIGNIKPSHTTTSRHFSPGVGSWPGRVDVYFDMYFATIWNISRTARCLLLDFILRLSEILREREPSDDHARHTQYLMTQLCDVIASIPYFLAEDAQAFLRDDTTQDIANTGRTAGGLLLMHQLYALSKLPMVFPEMRDYFNRCLAWIGERMGIGQASLFAKDTNISTEYVTSGRVIIWAALLV
ncbi:hypothetical protein BJX65DRAFT_131202 [Aspergillus insuetus]